MSKFHVNSQGKILKCEAKYKCPFSSEETHFTDEEQTQRFNDFINKYEIDLEGKPKKYREDTIKEFKRADLRRLLKNRPDINDLIKAKYKVDITTNESDYTEKVKNKLSLSLTEFNYKEILKEEELDGKFMNETTLNKENLNKIYSYISLLDFPEILDDYEKQISNLKVGFDKLDENTILDENKTVKWNREQIKKNNIEHEKEKEKIEKQKTELNKLLEELAKKDIENCFNDIEISEEKAEKIFSLAKEKSSSLKETMEYIYEFANILNEN